LLQDSEELTVAYNKRASILGQHSKEIMQKASSRALYAWVAGLTTGAANLLPSTGSARAATGTSQTLLRLAITKADILDALHVMDRQDIPQNGRNMIVTPTQHRDLLLIDDFVRADAYGTSNIPEGVIGKIYGCTVWVRSRCVTVAIANTIKTEEAVAVASDQDTAVFWQEDQVRTAMGSAKIFIDNDKPEYYGSIFSAMKRFGAVAARNDNKGIVGLYEDHSTL
jgi:hypothetical protein